MADPVEATPTRCCPRRGYAPQRRTSTPQLLQRSRRAVASSEAEAPAQPEPHQPSSAAVAAQAPAPQPRHTAAANSAPAEAAPAAAPVAAAEANAAAPGRPRAGGPFGPHACCCSPAQPVLPCETFVLPVSELQAVAQAGGLQ